MLTMGTVEFIGDGALMLMVGTLCVMCVGKHNRLKEFICQSYLVWEF